MSLDNFGKVICSSVYCLQKRKVNLQSKHSDLFLPLVLLLSFPGLRRCEDPSTDNPCSPFHQFLDVVDGLASFDLTLSVSCIPYIGSFS